LVIFRMLSEADPEIVTFLAVSVAAIIVFGGRWIFEKISP
jgi:hypothetical protein